MLTIAWHNLTHERGRFAVSVGGVAFSVVLILIVSGLYVGWNERITQYIESVRADFWVGQRGSADLSHSVSLLPTDLEPTLAGVPGVASVQPFVGRQIAFDLPKQTDVHFFLVGFDPDSGENGPIEMVRGSRTPGDKELIVDRAFAEKNGVGVGDTITFKSGEDWKIVGISSGGNQVIRTFAYAKLPEVRRLFGLTTLTNYFLVTVEPGADPAAVRRAIEDAGEVEVTPRSDFIDENKKLIRETFLPIIGVLLAIAFAIGAAVIGLTIYTATIEKAGEYGVLKALGFSRSRLFRIVLAQSFLASTLGFVLGILLAFGVAWLAQTVEPSFVTAFKSSMVVEVFFLTIAMAVVAAWAPTHRIASIDPAEVFRA